MYMRHMGGQETVNNSVKQVLNSVIWDLNSVKQVLNSVKHVINEVKLTANGRVNLKYSINQPRDPKTGCVPRPLGSPTGVRKVLFRRVRTAVRVVRQVGVPGGVWDRGGYREG